LKKVVNPEPYPTFPELLYAMGQNGGYPLVNVYILRTGKIHHAINGTTHYFDWAMFNSFSYVYQRVPSIFFNGPHEHSTESSPFRFNVPGDSHDLGDFCWPVVDLIKEIMKKTFKKQQRCRKVVFAYIFIYTY